MCCGRRRLANGSRRRGTSPEPHSCRCGLVAWLDPAGSDYARTPTDPEAPTVFERLSAPQREFAVVVLGSAPDLYYLSGRAGFGKSHVARYLVHAFRSVGKLVAVTGTTATAASNIGGVTLHRFLKLSKGFESSLEPSHAMWPVLKTISVVIVDEISMATAHLLSALDHVLHRAHLPDCKRLSFGGRTIIAIGDLCQLPPVPPRLFGWYTTTALCMSWAFGGSSACTS